MCNPIMLRSIARGKAISTCFGHPHNRMRSNRHPFGRQYRNVARWYQKNEGERGRTLTNGCCLLRFYFCHIAYDATSSVPGSFWCSMLLTWKWCMKVETLAPGYVCAASVPMEKHLRWLLLTPRYISMTSGPSH